RMVGEAFGPLHLQGVKTLLPMRPPPAGLHRSSPLVKRTLDLLFSARRAQLKDKDRVSRTAEGQASVYRDPEDMAGLSSALAAYETLRASGRRHPDLGRASSKRQKTQLSYLHLDVVPEARLYLTDAPDTQTLG